MTALFSCSAADEKQQLCCGNILFSNSICSAQPSEGSGKAQRCHLKHSSCDSSLLGNHLCSLSLCWVCTPCWVSAGHSQFQGKFTFVIKVKFSASIRVKAVEATQNEHRGVASASGKASVFLCRPQKVSTMIPFFCWLPQTNTQSLHSISPTGACALLFCSSHRCYGTPHLGHLRP